MLIALCICIVIILLLLMKIIVMKRSAAEIAEKYKEITSTDTNAIIGIKSRDKDMMRLAAELNNTLVNVRSAYHRYSEGDMEMKMAITNISHDLRTPLTAILGHLALLKKEDKSPEVNKTLDIIEDRAQYMKKLTEELFEYSVILSSDGETPKENVMINQVLEDSLMNHYAALTQKGIEPEVDITEEQVIRNVNRQQVDRIFSNLMSNALKYSGGDLKISLTPDGKVTFTNKAPGLTKLDVEKLFTRFYTVESARNSTGLGLAIVRKFVEENGGKIEASYEDEMLSIVIRF